MSRFKSLRWVPALAVLVLISAACEQAPEREAAAPEAVEDPLGTIEIPAGAPIRIGVFQALTGSSANLGVDQLRAVEIGVEDRGGELLGHPIELVEADGGCRAGPAETAAQQLLAEPQLAGIVGTSCTDEAVAAMDDISEAGLTMISGSNTSPFVTQIPFGTEGPDHHPGYFRTAHNDIFQGRAAATFALEELGVTRAASIHDGDPYTSGLAGAFDDSFEELGGEIVLATSVSKDVQDARPVLTEVAAAEAEVVFFPIFEPAGNVIAQQAPEVSGLEDVILFGADGLLTETFITTPESTGMFFSGPATPEDPRYGDLLEKYEAAYGEEPIGAFHAHAFDAFNILMDSMEQVAVEQPDGTLVVPKQALRDAVEATSGHEGLTGSLSCDEFGDCAATRLVVVEKTPDTDALEAVRANVLFEFTPEE
jgi:branched-chain amino acid transport system substrate-binding protein